MVVPIGKARAIDRRPQLGAHLHSADIATSACSAIDAAEIPHLAGLYRGSGHAGLSSRVGQGTGFGHQYGARAGVEHVDADLVGGSVEFRWSRCVGPVKAQAPDASFSIMLKPSETKAPRQSPSKPSQLCASKLFRSVASPPARLVRPELTDVNPFALFSMSVTFANVSFRLPFRAALCPPPR